MARYSRQPAQAAAEMSQGFLRPERSMIHKKKMKEPIAAVSDDAVEGNPAHP
jgi:hypothetical protein